MRHALLVLLVVCGSCGGANKPDPDPDPGPSGTGSPIVEQESRSQIQIRQDAACEQTGKKLRQCAIEDNQKQSPEERQKADVEHTAPILEREYIKACTAAQMSSRQVRVHEVCLREETECEAFLDCLDNAKPQK
jgi:hypothetical protein